MTEEQIDTTIPADQPNPLEPTEEDDDPSDDEPDSDEGSDPIKEDEEG